MVELKLSEVITHLATGGSSFRDVGVSEGILE